MRAIGCWGALLAAVAVVGCNWVSERGLSRDTQGIAAGDDHARAGLEWYREGRCDQAIRELRLAAKLPSKATDKKVVLTHLGVCYETTGHLAEAAAAQQHALKLDPKYSKAWGYLGIVRRKQGKMAEARRCYDRAVALDPRNDEALSSLGTWLLLDKRPEEAVKVLEKSIALDGSYPTPYANLAVAYAQLGRSEDATRAVAKAAELGYPPPKLAALRGRVTAIGTN